jgi:hypothetical protein
MADNNINILFYKIMVKLSITNNYDLCIDMLHNIFNLNDNIYSFIKIPYINKLIFYYKSIEKINIYKILLNLYIKSDLLCKIKNKIFDICTFTDIEQYNFTNMIPIKTVIISIQLLNNYFNYLNSYKTIYFMFGDIPTNEKIKKLWYVNVKDYIISSLICLTKFIKQKILINAKIKLFRYTKVIRFSLSSLIKYYTLIIRKLYKYFKNVLILCEAYINYEILYYVMHVTNNYTFEAKNYTTNLYHNNILEI